MLRPDAVACLMSGMFTQRGSAAVTDKWTRAETALRHGADLVLELHPAYAVASAEYFAMGALRTINAFGARGWLSFGAENDDMALLRAISDVLLEEPAPYRRALAQGLDAGHSFAKARADAAARYMGKAGAGEDAGEDAGEGGGLSADGNARGAAAAGSAAAAHSSAYSCADVELALKSPNSILALEYLKAIKAVNPPVEPFAVKLLDTPGATEIRGLLRGYARRIAPEGGRRGGGDGRSEGDGSDGSGNGGRAGDGGGSGDGRSEGGGSDGSGNGGCAGDGGGSGDGCGASQNRAEAAAYAAHAQDMPTIMSAFAPALMPAGAAAILDRAFSAGKGPVFDEDYFIQLLTVIRRTPRRSLAGYGDMGEGLENRIARAARDCADYESLLDAVSTRRYPKTRIRRIFTRMLLGFDSETMGALDIGSGPPYIRVLGFNAAGRRLLAHVGELRKKNGGAAPIVTTFAQLKRICDPRTRAFAELDETATDIYVTTFADRRLRMAGRDYYEALRIAGSADPAPAAPADSGDSAAPAAPAAPAASADSSNSAAPAASVALGDSAAPANSAVSVAPAAPIAPAASAAPAAPAMEG
jgi:predicted nucleotidyltransferase